jgi:hypothetical protein
MTSFQKITLVVLVCLGLLLAALVFGGMLGTVLLWLAVLTGLTGQIVVIAETSLKKSPFEDERDRLYGNRSFIAAYFALMFCLFAGLFAAFLSFHGESIPLRFVLKWVGGSWVVSMLVQSGAVLVQYRNGIRDNS